MTLTATAVLLVSMAAVSLQSGAGYELIGGVADREAQSLSGAGYELSGAILVPDTQGTTTESMAAGEYSLTGAILVTVETPASAPCSADLLDPSGVGVEDLLALLDCWGCRDVPADLDGDGVEVTDLVTLLSQWGPCR
jgi:hypothetical protein